MGSANEKPYNHASENGTWFESDRCDFRNGIKYRKPVTVSDDQFAADVAEMTAQHLLSIHHELDGFAGYANLKFHVLEGEEVETTTAAAIFGSLCEGAAVRLEPDSIARERHSVVKAAEAYASGHALQPGEIAAGRAENGLCILCQGTPFGNIVVRQEPLTNRPGMYLDEYCRLCVGGPMEFFMLYKPHDPLTAEDLHFIFGTRDVTGPWGWRLNSILRRHKR